MTNKALNIIMRYLALFVGLSIMSFGIAFSIKADLGTSPVSAPPYVASLVSSLTLGQATIIMHIFFIALQALMLRRDFKMIQLLQIVLALFFGVMNDVAMDCIAPLSCETYAMKWIFCIIGIVLVAVGVSFEVNAGTIYLAGEGVCVAFSQVSKWNFSYVKVGFDIICVVVAVIWSMLALGKVAGVREGTLAAMLLVGLCTKLTNPAVHKLLPAICQKPEQ